jgi:transposase
LFSYDYTSDVLAESRTFLTDARWATISESLATLSMRGPKGDARSFIGAVIWILRTGAPWRDLGERFGRWERIYRRYRRWAIAGRWETLRQALGTSVRGKLLLIDSTIVKAHPHAAGALKRAGTMGAEALGRSRGGFTTKLHALVSENGELLRYLVTGGEVNDITQAKSLVPRREGTGIVGDRAYDSNAFIEHVRALKMRAIIPARSNRRKRRRLDRAGYARRNVIERWFGRVKAFRRVATRYDKTAASYLGFLATAAALVAITGWPG